MTIKQLMKIRDRAQAAYEDAKNRLNKADAREIDASIKLGQAEEDLYEAEQARAAIARNARI
jgi:hypothetical protein